MVSMAFHRWLDRMPFMSGYRVRLFTAVVAGALPPVIVWALWPAFNDAQPGPAAIAVLVAGVAGVALTALLAPAAAAAPAPDDVVADERAAITDPLTGLRNRHWCETTLARELDSGPLARGEFVLALINLDHLRRINASHGHAGGDACLQRVAEITARTLRTGDRLARWGGDEFVAVLRGRREEAQAALERLRRRLAEPPEHDTAIPMSVTIGAVASTGGGAVDALFRSADQALAGARASGRNRVAFFGD